MLAERMQVLGGIFVGGEGKRMGGADKARLETPDGETLVERWEPLFARYYAARVLELARAHVAAGKHSLQALLDAAGVEEFPIEGESGWAGLRDWDAPRDIPP